MLRRGFLTQASMAALLGSSALVGCDPSRGPKSAGPSEPDALEKVKQAMLCMQRDAWEQGVAAQALLEMGELDLVVLMAKEAAVRQTAEGRLASLSSFAGVTDPAANGEAVLWASEATADRGLRNAADMMTEYLLYKAPRTADGILYHVADKAQVWVDSLYMAPPFLAVAGHGSEAIRQIEGMRRRLWNPQRRLFSHIWDEGKQAFERGAFWGVGNGWAAAGMTRVLRALPRSMDPERARLAGHVRAVVEGCLEHQRPDGLFHDVVDDAASFVETNLAQMLAYAIYRGVEGGWLEPAYLERAARMREAAWNKVDRHGLVQGVCGSPDFSSPGTATEGQAFLLLMEAAARDCGARR